jgi:hypothetical protein
MFENLKPLEKVFPALPSLLEADTLSRDAVQQSKSQRTSNHHW